MKTELPLVSIIVPCFNAEKFLAETLTCVASVDYPNWECLIVNDGSTDQSEQIAGLFCEADSRFRLLSQENAGPSAARNMGIYHSTGQYILPLDADDLISKDYIKEAAEILAQQPEIKLVYCLARKFGRKTRHGTCPIIHSISC